MAVFDLTDLQPPDVVKRRIRRDWREEIVVIDEGVIEGGERSGESWVQIGCTSWIACEQARISLASFVRNDAEDWSTGWEILSDGQHRYRLRLVDPDIDGHEPIEPID
jgi:hypothetical protein